jgi:hypothetical protein
LTSTDEYPFAGPEAGRAPTGRLGGDGGELPAGFTAVTVNVYAIPGVTPANVTSV